MIILVGASASGKTEVAKLLKSNYGIKKVITHTTRAIRINEVADVDYHFVSKEEFLKLEKDDAFVETTFYNGNYYGSSKKEIADNKVLIVDPAGLEAYLKLKDKRIVTFYLDANEDTRFKRMLQRGDKKELAEGRIINDHEKFTADLKTKVNFVIDSEHNDLETITKEVYDLYTNYLKNL